MELKVPSPNRGLSPSDVFNDPKEKEISDDDDDDRNHKHRRRETESQSSDRVASEQAFTRSYRQGKKPFENADHPYRDANTQSNERRRYGGASSRASLDMNQRIRVDPVKPGRGRDSVSWNQRDPRFSSVHMIQQGSVAPNLFMGRGMPNVSNAPTGPWGGFGITNGGLDTLHPLGFQTTMRLPMNPSIEIPRQRCRDFEERGFCLRGDMCPMEHGVNRIVIEDVQSLSQFNLPVSLPSAHLLGAPTGPEHFPAISAPPGTLMNNKALHVKNSKLGVGENESILNGPILGEGDFYDPDQPLWNNGRPETSTPPLALNSTKGDEIDPLDDDHVDGSGYKRLIRSTKASLGSQRIVNSNSKSELTERIDYTKSSNHMGNKPKDEQEPLNNSHGITHIGNQIKGDSSMKVQNESSGITKKPFKKAERTLFVSGVPLEKNKKEVLLSHFKRFGQIIDIYIPLNSERAFIQFSKREEAEAALKAPDAVLGNRFIKLWWANRDNITDSGLSNGNTLHPYTSVINRVKDKNLQSASTKAGNPHGSVALVPASDQPESVIASGPKAPPPAQKKLENLMSLNEELRKKQEMLDKKRNEFKQKLDKLQKHATGLNGETATERAAKRPKAETTTDAAKASTPSSSSPTTTGTMLPTVEVTPNSGETAENDVSQTSKAMKTVAMKESSSFKQLIRPLAPVGASFVMNKFKLDNRPTAFKIIPPLPTGLADVAVLKEHFSMIGDLSAVDIIEESDSQAAGNDDSSLSKTSARISFINRRSAELAFVNSRSWKGHNLNFVWLPSVNPSKEIATSDLPSSPKDESSDAKAVTPSNGKSDKDKSSLTAIPSEKQSN